jgi:hypothetical protein
MRDDLAMSRRRTTKKLYQSNARTTAAEGEAPVAAAGETEARTTAMTGVSAETLERLLAAEASEREVTEQRTTDLVGRYFKLTLAMVCLNMVVAGANVALLFRRPPEVRAIVTSPVPAPPPPVAPAAAPAPAPAPAVAVPGTPEPQAPIAAEKIPLLGTPSKPPLLGTPIKDPALGKAAPVKRARAAKAPVMADPDGESGTFRPAPEPVRAVGSPLRAGSVLTAKLAEPADDARMPERW